MEDIVHSTSYKLYRPQEKFNGMRLGIISDLHYSYQVSDKKLMNIIDYLWYQSLNYLLLCGDLIDHIEAVEDLSEREGLLEWIKELSKICPLIISLGNHDSFKKCGRQWEYQFDKKLFDTIGSIDGVHVLNNEKYEDDLINAVGVTQPYEYFLPENGKDEDKNSMLETLRGLRHLLTGLDKEKLNLAMIHSPVFLTDEDVKKELQEFDYFISGHMHNGCVPPGLYEMWRSSRGLIAPSGIVLPPNERNTLKRKDDKLLVNGPLTVFGEGSPLMEKLNSLFPLYMSFMEFSNDPRYDTDKIEVTKKYEKIMH